MSSMISRIVFIDETAGFLRSRRFAELVKGSDNYFVIVSRDDLSQLPYSIDEIYGLRNVSDTQKYKTYKRIYNEMYKLYHLDPKGTIGPEAVITEDSNSGYEYFNMLYGGICVSAHGKSNVYIAGTGIDVGADIFRRGLCLPSDNKMTPEQQDRVIEIIHRCFQ